MEPLTIIGLLVALPFVVAFIMGAMSKAPSPGQILMSSVFPEAYGVTPESQRLAHRWKDLGFPSPMDYKLHLQHKLAQRTITSEEHELLNNML